MTNSFPTRRSSELYGHGWPLFDFRIQGRMHELPVEQRDRFDMRSMREHVHHAGRGQLEAVLVDQDAGIARERRRMAGDVDRSGEHTSELQSLMRISYAVFCL